ncbi:hypothetical protein CNQ82_09590 [Staphylococcus debuckii]|nr:hypothetical protein CNQ82_09590 [Staphylococcus debuckii]
MELLELLALFLSIGCTIYICKNLFLISLNYVGEFIYSLHISRSEDGNQFIGLVSTIIFTLIAYFIILILSYIIFKRFFLIPIIALCLYFRFGTDTGK